MRLNKQSSWAVNQMPLHIFRMNNDAAGLFFFFALCTTQSSRKNHETLSRALICSLLPLCGQQLFSSKANEKLCFLFAIWKTVVSFQQTTFSEFEMHGYTISVQQLNQRVANEKGTSTKLNVRNQNKKMKNYRIVNRMNFLTRWWYHAEHLFLQHCIWQRKRAQGRRETCVSLLLTTLNCSKIYFSLIHLAFSSLLFYFVQQFGRSFSCLTLFHLVHSSAMFFALSLFVSVELSVCILCDFLIVFFIFFQHYFGKWTTNNKQVYLLHKLHKANETTVWLCVWWCTIRCEKQTNSFQAYAIVNIWWRFHANDLFLCFSAALRLHGEMNKFETTEKKRERFSNEFFWVVSALNRCFNISFVRFVEKKKYNSLSCCDMFTYLQHDLTFQLKWMYSFSIELISVAKQSAKGSNRFFRRKLKTVAIGNLHINWN